MKGVYLHVPFCEARCHYCDFTRFDGIDNREKKEYLEALGRELEYQLKRFPKFCVPDTLFIGGGTPTSLDEEELEYLLKSINKFFSVSNVLEFTVEANPNTLSERKLSMLLDYGVTRLSMGVQSFNDVRLKKIGRLHTVERVREAYKLARELGFKRISLDLIYGLPGMSMREWQDTIEQALRLEPDHLSLYQLAIEEGTYFGELYQKGELCDFPDELAAQMVCWHKERLAQEGYFPYEISNYAKVGQASIHNQIYWQLRDYLSFGCGATSWIRPKRWMNTSNLRDYIRASEGSWQVEEEQLDFQEMMIESVIMGLRQNQGLEEKYFEDLYQKDLNHVFPEAIAQAIKNKWLVRERGFLKLTDKGRLLGNLVFELFV